MVDNFIPLTAQNPLEDAVQAVVAFINAPDWMAGRAIVQEKREVLFSPQGVQAFELLLQQYAEQPDQYEMVRQHREILARCQEQGIEPVFDLLTSLGDVPDAVIEAVMEYLNAPLWSASREVVVNQSRWLMNDDAERVIRAMMVRHRPGSDDHRDLREHLEVLQHCRTQGVEATFDQIEQLVASNPPAEVIEAALAFINAGTLDEKRQVFQQKENLLLSGHAENVFERLLAQYAERISHAAIVENHRNLLRRCAAEGADAVFDQLKREAAPVVTREVLEAVRYYIEAATLHEQRALLEERQSVLLSEAGEAAMHLVMRQVSDQPEVQAALQERLVRLQQARAEGIAAAFAEV
ncbi:MAG: hypothetical protein HC915_06055 [Anaerolineae bacterium]|nr:hypothetical protein [Anaerolineae bacterium]